MINETLHAFCDNLMQDDMSLLYSGSFSDDLTDQIIGLNSVHFEDEAEFKKIQRKTGFLIAECFQNIIRHSEPRIQNGYFHTKKSGDSFNIVSGNTIENQKIDDLKKQLEEVNTFSNEDLKKAYLETLTNNQISDKGGAGLGLIEMARKTKNKLNNHFEKLDDRISYFYLQLKINTNGQPSDMKAGKALLDESIALRKSMLENNFFLIYKGDVSMAIILPLLDMVENSFAGSSEELQGNKKVFLVLTEFLQNISKHGASVNKKNEGLVLIGHRDGKYLIGGMNYIKEEEVAKLSELLETYSQSDNAFLNEEYKKILRDGDPENKNGSSLGLIEMARRSSKMEYDFQESSNGLVKFTLTIQL